MAFVVSREITATPSVIIGFPEERLDVHYLAVGGLTEVLCEEIPFYSCYLSHWRAQC